MRSLERALTVLSGLAVLSPALCHAEQPVQRLSQYGHSSWHVQDGLFSSPNGITQTKDGYLWIGTDAGLVRFDGVRFVAWNTFQDANSAGRSVAAVFAASDGSLWLGSGRQVLQLQGSRIARYEVPGIVSQLTQSSTGEILVAQTRTNGRGGPVCEIASGKLSCFGAPDLPLNAVATASAAPEGGWWLGGGGGLCHWSPGTLAHCFLKEALAPLSGLSSVSAVLSAKDGTLWVGIPKAGHDMGLGQLINGNWKTFMAPGLDGQSVAVSSVLEDREGSVWLGTLDNGLYRIRGATVEHFGRANGLSSDAVAGRGLYEDREGTIWVVTSSGLDSFRHLPVTVFSSREGLPADGVESVLAAHDGTVWFGNWTLSILSQNQTAAPPHPELFAGKSVTSLLEDHAHRLWIGLDRTLNVFENGVLKPIPSPSGGEFGIAESIAEDSAHDVWVTTAEANPKLLRIRDQVVKEQINRAGSQPTAMASDPSGGIWIGYYSGAIASYRGDETKLFAADNSSKAPITALLVEEDGTLLATTLKGLLIQQGVSRRLLNIERGLPCDRLMAIVHDARNSIWLSANCGLIELRGSELSRWKSDPSTKIQYHLLDVTDGVQPGYGSFMPRASLGPDGRVWFATGKVAQVIDPAGLERASVPPPLRIETITVDRKTYAPEEAQTLPARPRDIEIRYTALSFVVPQKIKFKYRLEGRDDLWNDADTRREAFYSDLPPGSYSFHVKASNSDGVWNDADASMNFKIPPAFYQTKWFDALCLVVVLALMYGLYFIRLKQAAAKIRGHLAAREAERERIARELHDTLLQSTQGLILRFQAAANQIPPLDPTRALLDTALVRADEVLAEGRDRVLDLRVSNDALSDLPRAFSAAGEEFAQGRSVTFRTTVEGTARDLLRTVKDETYRIGREALLNAFQHSGANSIELQIIYADNDFRVRVRDDGRGIDPGALEERSRPGHWGITGMRERAQKIGAHFEIWSRHGAGTEIELKIPASVAYKERRFLSRWWPWRSSNQEMQ